MVSSSVRQKEAGKGEAEIFVIGKTLPESEIFSLVRIGDHTPPFLRLVRNGYAR